MASKKDLKELLFTLFDGSDDADEIKDTLRGMEAEWQISKEDYDTILENWEDWLQDWRNENEGGHPVQKHGNYDQNETIQISRLGEDEFRLFYEAENYEFVCSGEELLEELEAHIYLKKF